MLTTSETNARGWYRWCLIDTITKEIMRTHFKPEAEVDEDNQLLIKNKSGYLWVVYRE